MRREDTQLQMVPLFAGMLGLLFVVALFSGQVEASEAKLACTTQYGEYRFVVKNDKVSYLDHQQTRSISSIQEDKAQNKASFSQTLIVTGNKHEVKVKNWKSPNEIDDHLVVTNAKGHKMTYSLNCYQL